MEKKAPPGPPPITTVVALSANGIGIGLQRAYSLPPRVRRSGGLRDHVPTLVPWLSRRDATVGQSDRTGYCDLRQQYRQPVCFIKQNEGSTSGTATVERGKTADRTGTCPQLAPKKMSRIP